MKTKNIQNITFTALMAALLCILAPVSIPLPEPAPAITLAFFAVYLSACLIGPWHTCAALLIYLLLGIFGLPVFSKGQGGLQVVVGPTGGYLLGYFPLAITTGLIVRRFEKKLYGYVLGMVAGTLVCYTLGTIWLGFSMHLSAGAAIAAGVLPFLPGDALKMAGAIAICYPVRRQLGYMLPSGSPEKTGSVRASGQ